MSISSAMGNALSGLLAQTRASEVVSSNVSNALTEGYGRRDIVLGTSQLGGVGSGVQVSGVLREVDAYVIAERRLAQAELAQAGTLADFHARMEQVLGAADSPSSLAGRVSALERALTEAESRPDSQLRLDAVVSAARDLTAALNNATSQVQELRQRADRDVAQQIETLNAGLARIRDLNVQIRARGGSGADVNALLDQRQVEIDALSLIVPIRIARRDHGQVALYTAGGAVLLDGNPAQIDFAPANVITPDMSVGGALGQVTIAGRPVSALPGGQMAGGSLGAAFQVRDQLAVSAQADLDAFARELVVRFSDPTVDTTLPPGAPGLFTDNGLAFDPLQEVGLAGRIVVNAAVDSGAGGASWRIRDGLGAATAGPVGEAALIAGLSGILRSALPISSGQLAGSSRDIGGMAGELITLAGAQQARADAARDFARASHDTWKQKELEGAVDTDQEMQELLLIEQAYAANARVLTTASAMLDVLMEI